MIRHEVTITETVIQSHHFHVIQVCSLGIKSTTLKCLELQLTEKLKGTWKIKSVYSSMLVNWIGAWMALVEGLEVSASGANYTITDFRLPNPSATGTFLTNLRRKAIGRGTMNNLQRFSFLPQRTMDPSRLHSQAWIFWNARRKLQLDYTTSMVFCPHCSASYYYVPVYYMTLKR